MNSTFWPKHAKTMPLFVLAFALILSSCGDKPSSSSSSSEDTSVYEIVNGDFETGTLEGWTVISGTAFSEAGVSDDTNVSETITYGKHGSYFYKGTLESNVGIMESSSFVLGGSGYLSFFLGGAYLQALTYISVVDAETDIELARYGNTLYNNPAMSADDTYRVENMVAYHANLFTYLGRSLKLRIVDQSTANGGYLTLDNIVTYYPSAPSSATSTLATDIKPTFPDYAGTPTVLANQGFANGTLSSWSVIGESGVFRDSHIDANKKLSNRTDESKIGVLRSSSFKLGGSGAISLRIGATKHSDLTYVSIKKVGTNEEIYRTYSDRWSDADEENTHLYYIDVYAHLGEALYLELVDNSRSDWGLIVVEALTTYLPTIPKVTDEVAVNLMSTIKTNYDYSFMRTYMTTKINALSDETLRTTLNKTFYATLDGISNSKGTWGSVLRYQDDGETFVYTGDIAAMWLRDSSAQVLPYLRFMNQDEDVRLMVRGLLRKQFEFIRRHPYANAFNEDGSVFENKFEIDSLVYPLWLADQYFTITQDATLFDAFFLQTLDTVITTLNNERNHSDTNYRVENATDRANSSNDINPDCGLIWSGYRPSDDVTYYKYFIPGNMFAVATMEKMASLLTAINRGSALASSATTLANEVRSAIETYGVYQHPTYGKMYVFETNGMNSDASSLTGKLIMDAANIPSLISAPWLGYVDKTDPTYVNTRAFALSDDNPYYYEGTYAKGIGDPHDQVGGPAVWHMAIAMQGLTSANPDEIEQCIAYMVNTTAGTYVMHEAFNADNPSEYSRDFFTWPCALFAELYLSKILNLSDLN